MEFEIGETVRIINNDEYYTTYLEMFNLLNDNINLIFEEEGYPEKGDIGVIINKGMHEDRDDMIHLVQIENKCFLMSKDGIEKAPDKFRVLNKILSDLRNYNNKLDELNIIRYNINAKWHGIDLNIHPNFEICKEGFDFKFGSINENEDSIEIDYFVKDEADENENIECSDYIAVEQFINYVEIK